MLVVWFRKMIQTWWKPSLSTSKFSILQPRSSKSFANQPNSVSSTISDQPNCAWNIRRHLLAQIRVKTNPVQPKPDPGPGPVDGQNVKIDLSDLRSRTKIRTQTSKIPVRIEVCRTIFLHQVFVFPPAIFQKVVWEIFEPHDRVRTKVVEIIATDFLT